MQNPTKDVTTSAAQADKQNSSKDSASPFEIQRPRTISEYEPALSKDALAALASTQT